MSTQSDNSLSVLRATIARLEGEVQQYRDQIGRCEPGRVARMEEKNRQLAKEVEECATFKNDVRMLLRSIDEVLPDEYPPNGLSVNDITTARARLRCGVARLKESASDKRIPEMEQQVKDAQKRADDARVDRDNAICRAIVLEGQLRTANSALAFEKAKGSPDAETLRQNLYTVCTRLELHPATALTEICDKIEELQKAGRGLKRSEEDAAKLAKQLEASSLTCAKQAKYIELLERYFGRVSFTDMEAALEKTYARAQEANRDARLAAAMEEARDKAGAKLEEFGKALREAVMDGNQHASPSFCVEFVKKTIEAQNKKIAELSEQVANTAEALWAARGGLPDLSVADAYFEGVRSWLEANRDTPQKCIAVGEDASRNNAFCAAMDLAGKLFV